MRGGLFLDQALGPNLRLSMQGLGLPGRPRRRQPPRGGQRVLLRAPAVRLPGRRPRRPGGVDPGLGGRRLGAAGGRRPAPSSTTSSSPRASASSKQATDTAAAGRGHRRHLHLPGAQDASSTAGAYLQGMWKAAGELAEPDGRRSATTGTTSTAVRSASASAWSPTLCPTCTPSCSTAAPSRRPRPLLLLRHPLGDRRRAWAIPSSSPSTCARPSSSWPGSRRSTSSLSSNVVYNVLSDKTEFVQQGINKVARNVARAGDAVLGDDGRAASTSRCSGPT